MITYSELQTSEVIKMAKLTKAQARKRIKEAEAKLMAVASSYPSAISFMTMDKIFKITLSASKKLK